jgi:voltage-gated potassium channel Kch
MLPGIHDQAPESIGSQDVLLGAPAVRRKTFLRSYWPWGLMLVVGIVAVVLGYAGLVKYFAAEGEQRSLLDLVYMILCLFVLETGDVSGPAPWELALARVLAPILPAWAIFRAAAIVFRDQWQALRLLLATQHVVICGLGRKGFQLARELHARGELVVVIEENEGDDSIASCRELGITALVANAADPITLNRARAQHARHVFAVCGEDGTNVEIAVHVDELVRNRKRHRTRDVHCHVQIVDLELCELFRQHRIFLDPDDPLKVRVFNTFENSARLVWHRHPLDRLPIGPDDPRCVHLVVIGFGQMGESIVVQAARTAHLANGRRPRITVVDEFAEEKQKRFYARYPQFDNVCDARFLTGLASDLHVAAEICQAAAQSGVLATVAVCLDGDARALSAALGLLAKLRSCDVPVIVRMAEEKGLATLFHGRKDQSSHLADRLHAFGMTSRSCSLDLLLNEDLDRLAIAIHESYRNKSNAAGDPASKPWKTLSENLKDSNRYQADHIPVKLRAIGCYASTVQTGDEVVESFTNDEIEIMARMEHARWNAERWLDGWTLGSKDHAAKTSPYLVDWEQLPDEIQQYDRNAVIQIPSLLKRLSAEIHRRGTAHENPNENVGKAH